MNIYAHRGLCAKYPENSASAILAAIKKGLDVEIDLRFSKDKKIVLIHDSNFRRLCGDNREVSALFQDDISMLSFEDTHNERFCFLEDILSEEAYQNSPAKIAMHFKQEDQIRENCDVIVDIFRKWNLFEKAFLFNLSIKTAEYIRQLNDRIGLSCIISDVKFEPYVYLWKEIKGQPLNVFDVLWVAEYKQLYADAFFEDAMATSKNIIAVSHELHRNLGHPKAIRGYQDTWMKFLDWKIDGVCTDYPEKFYQYEQKGTV